MDKNYLEMIQRFEAAFSDLSNPSFVISRKMLRTMERTWTHQDKIDFCEWAKVLPPAKCIQICQALAHSTFPEFTDLIGFFADTGHDELTEISFESLNQNIPELLKMNTCLSLLKSRRERVRAKACETLGRLGNLRPREELLECLKDKSDEVVEAALNALKSIGFSDISEYLETVLKHRSAKLRITALEALVVLVADRSFPFKSVARILQKDSDEKVRAAAAWALGKRPVMQTVEYLLKAIDDPSTDVRCAAATSLGQFSDETVVEKLIWVICSRAPYELNIACRRSLAIQNQLNVLIAADRMYKKMNDTQKIKIIEIISSVSTDEKKAVLLKKLSVDSHVVVIASVIESLGTEFFEDDSLWDMIIGYTVGQDPVIVRAAVISLGRMLNEKRLMPYIEQIEKLKSHNTLLAALRKIAIFGKANFIPDDEAKKLSRYIEFSDPQISAIAAQCLTHSNYKESVRLMMKKLSLPLHPIIEESLCSSVIELCAQKAENILLIGGSEFHQSFIKMLPFFSVSREDMLASFEILTDLFLKGIGTELTIASAASYYPEYFNFFFENNTGKCYDLIEKLALCFDGKTLVKMPGVVLSLFRSSDRGIRIGTIEKIPVECSEYIFSRLAEVAVSEDKEVSNAAFCKINGIIREAHAE